MDRRTTAAALRRLGDEALAREPSLGTLLGRLADAVDEGRATEASGYIGAIGSRTTNEERFAWLREQGFGDDDLARVHAPIGLDIGAGTAEEIALAILAEVVAVRRHRNGRSLSADSIVAAR